MSEVPTTPTLPPAAAAPEAAPASRARRLSARLLPRGVELPETAWRRRHGAVCLFMWLVTATAVVWAVVDASAVAIAEAALVVLASAATAAVPTGRRRLAASAASVSMLLSTAVLVHLSDGLIEMHFLFFVIVAAVTLYQQWAPFLSAVAFVVLHHGVIGTTHPEATYNHQPAIDHPWLWAGVHGGFIALASIVGLAAWRFDELVRDELRQVGEHSRVVLDSVGDAVLALAPDGTVLSANARATRLLRATAAGLVGRHVHDVVHPGAAHDPADCPFVDTATGTATGTGTDEVDPARDGGAAVPVTYRLASVEAEGPATAVLTLTDISGARRALVAERRLRHLSAERLVERAEVEQLVASVSPAPLQVPGADLAAAYVPASEALLGGDLYDWFIAPDGAVHLTVVDAMGKGRGATKHAMAVVHALRVLALDGHALDQVLGRAAHVLAGHDDALMATAVVARYRTGTGVVEVASAGHPPALVVRRDGRCELIETVGIGLGVPGAGSLELRSTTLGPGDTLVLYSDGLIEGTRDLDRGLTDLAASAAAVATEPVSRMVERLVQEPASVALDDDRVALALRRDEVTVVATPAAGPCEAVPRSAGPATSPHSSMDRATAF